MQGASTRPADPAVPLDSVRAAEVSLHVTVLHAPGKRLVKRFDADGRKHGYDNAAEFLIERHEVLGFQGWCSFLDEVERQPDRCVIRGAPGPWASPAHPAYRLLHPQLAYTDRRGRRVTREEVLKARRQDEIGVSLHPTTYLPMFVEEPTWWVLLDFEGIEFEPDWRRRLAETAAWLKLRLPDAFADVTCWFQATGGAADPSKPDLGGAWVRMRLGFLLSRPLTQEQLEAWLGSVPGLDPVTFRTVQPIYIGRPVFARGLADPIPIRSGVLEGLEEVVQVPDDLPAPRPQAGQWHVSAELAEGEGLGLLDCPELDDALADISGDAGKTRSALGLAAWAYIRAVGRSRVDVAALTARLAEEGLKHRSSGEVAGYGLEALVRWHLARAPADDEEHPAQELLSRLSHAAEAPEEPQLEALPDFGPARADRGTALAELHQEIAQELAEAAERIALRRELERRRKEAKEAAAAPFGDPKCLDAHKKRKLKAAMAKASKKAKAEYLAELGLEELPPRAAILHTGAQGSGKTLTVAKRLAGLKGGNVLMLVPTLKKAEELEAEIERQIKLRADAGEPVSMFVKVWRGRLAPPPEGERHPAQGFFDKHGINFNRSPSERMCTRPKTLIDDAQKAGCRIRATFCGTCSMRFDCRYLDQLDTLERLEGRLILIAAHDVMFTPLPFRPDLVVIDESVISKAARAIEIAPERLLDAEKWEDASYATDIVGEGTPLIEIAETAAYALAQPGRELATLRDAGSDGAALAACQGHLNDLHETMVEEIAEAGKGGSPEGQLRDMIDRLKVTELRSLALLFSNLRMEIATGRAGTNATRLIRGRVKKIEEPDGSTREERLDRYVISRPRGHGLGSQAELILLDGTGNLVLNQHVFGDDLVEKRCSVNRRGPIIQVTSTTNSKYRLLARPEADRNRRKMRRLIADLSTALDRSLLVGSTKKLEAKLLEEGALEGVQSMHFGAERGMNSAEHCEAVLVIGREQPQLAALEDLARGFTIASDEPFVSVLDANEEGELRLYRRRRRMRDSSEAWAEVRSHPDPFARALLEQIREAAIAQMADRVRAIWNDRLTVIATSVPVDLDVTLVTTQGELMRAASLAAAGKRGVDERGWWLQPVEAAQRGGEAGNWRVTAETVIDTLIQKALLLTSFPALLPTAGGNVPLRTALWSCLPQAEAFRLAAATHPGLRAPPPPGGVLRECLRRHGLLVAWPDLTAAVPELVPDAVALRAVKDAERGELKELRADLLTAPYRAAGRRGPAGTVAWDPTRIADLQAALARLLGAGVTVDWQPSPEPELDIMNPETWTPPPGVIEDNSEAPPMWDCRRLSKAPPVYVVADLFKISDHVMAIVSCHPDPSLVMEEAA